jgi:glutamyl-Q tRNA(Asp) synthetase
MTPAPYRGRFAPSPTGPLHFGSLVAALASYLDARAVGGQWLVRMEDIDTPRTMPGAAASILSCLEVYGLHWDGPVLYQSARLPAYRQALEQLARDGHVFGCACTRRDLGESGLYPGTCRGGLPEGVPPRAWRLRVDSQPVEFLDRLYGPRRELLTETCGDFVLLRADGIFAYQLAVVVDDAFQGITDVVRGSDLLDSTARQIVLQRRLGYPLPRYLHIPIVVDENGEKLSKQTRAQPVPDLGSPAVLARAIAYLAHCLGVPFDRAGRSCGELIEHAVEWWRGCIAGRSLTPSGCGEPPPLPPGSPPVP